MLDCSFANALCQLESLCFSQPWNISQFKNSLTSSNFRAWGLWNGQLLAYLSVYLIGKEMEIINFGVHPEYRKAGLGKTLLGRVLQAADKMGIQKIWLEVRASNTTAIAIYEKAGFKKTGIRKKYYSDTKENAIIYVREEKPSALPSK